MERQGQSLKELPFSCLCLPQSLIVFLLIRTYPWNFILICTITNKQHNGKVVMQPSVGLGMIAKHKSLFIDCDSWLHCWRQKSLAWMRICLYQWSVDQGSREQLWFCNVWSVLGLIYCPDLTCRRWERPHSNLLVHFCAAQQLISGVAGGWKHGQSKPNPSCCSAPTPNTSCSMFPFVEILSISWL